MLDEVGVDAAGRHGVGEDDGADVADLGVGWRVGPHVGGEADAARRRRRQHRVAPSERARRGIESAAVLDGEGREVEVLVERIDDQHVVGVGGADVLVVERVAQPLSRRRVGVALAVDRRVDLLEVGIDRHAAGHADVALVEVRELLEARRSRPGVELAAPGGHGHSAAGAARHRAAVRRRRDGGRRAHQRPAADRERPHRHVAAAALGDARAGEEERHAAAGGVAAVGLAVAVVVDAVEADLRLAAARGFVEFHDLHRGVVAAIDVFGGRRRDRHVEESALTAQRRTAAGVLEGQRVHGHEAGRGRAGGEIAEAEGDRAPEEALRRRERRQEGHLGRQEIGHPHVHRRVAARVGEREVVVHVLVADGPRRAGLGERQLGGGRRRRSRTGDEQHVVERFRERTRAGEPRGGDVADVGRTAEVEPGRERRRVGLRSRAPGVGELSGALDPAMGEADGGDAGRDGDVDAVRERSLEATRPAAVADVERPGRRGGEREGHAATGEGDRRRSRWRDSGGERLVHRSDERRVSGVEDQLGPRATREEERSERRDEHTEAETRSHDRALLVGPATGRGIGDGTP